MTQIDAGGILDIAMAGTSQHSSSKMGKRIASKCR